MEWQSSPSCTVYVERHVNEGWTLLAAAAAVEADTGVLMVMGLGDETG
jgi:hypothetical protein